MDLALFRRALKIVQRGFRRFLKTFRKIKLTKLFCSVVRSKQVIRTCGNDTVCHFHLPKPFPTAVTYCQTDVCTLQLQLRTNGTLEEYLPRIQIGRTFNITRRQRR